MDFALSDDQILLQDQMNRAFADLASAPTVSGMVRDNAADTGGLWRDLCELGIPGLLVPAVHGGLGAGLLETALVAEIMGRYAVPSHFLGAVVAAPVAIMAAGSTEQCSDLLPRIARGDLRIAVAVSEPLAGARHGGGVRLENGVLNGSAQMVVDIGGADLVLVADMQGQLCLIAPDAAGVNRSALDIVDRTRSAACVEFVGAAPHTVLQGQGQDGALARVGAALRVVVAADLLGTADHMVATAVEYAKVRHQFGRAIGSFQAVKHLCAEMAAEVEAGRALIWYAAYAQDHGLNDAMLTTLHAKSYIGDAARMAARGAIEVHGGIGITDELNLHIWFKRVTFSTQLFGGPTRLRQEAAALQDQGSAQLVRNEVAT